VQLLRHEARTDEAGAKVVIDLRVDGQSHTVVGQGNGPIAAFIDGLKRTLGIEIDVHDYAEHAVSAGSSAKAAAYVEVRATTGTVRWGVGIDESILAASLKAVISAVNRLRSAAPATADAS
jgi:2-isopropylmalate synthase